MTDINKQIEEEAEKCMKGMSPLKQQSLSMDGKYYWWNHFKDGFINGANYVLHSSRWRKFGVDDLPKIGRQIICRDGDKYHLSKPISHDGIHWLAEHFIEWKPID